MLSAQASAKTGLAPTAIAANQQHHQRQANTGQQQADLNQQRPPQPKQNDSACDPLPAEDWLATAPTPPFRRLPDTDCRLHSLPNKLLNRRQSTQHQKPFARDGQSRVQLAHAAPLLGDPPSLP